MSVYLKFLRLFWVLVLGGFFLIGSCLSDCPPDNNDTTPPVITIKGDNPIEIIQGETYVDPGATATDNSDESIKVTTSGEVDIDNLGTYTITYTAIDSAGNKAKATRTVIVKMADVVWNVSNVAEFRQALEDAANNGTNDRIVLSKGTYSTTSDEIGTFEFNDNEEYNLTIQAKDGLTYKDVILDGNNTNGVLSFNNTKNSTLILKNITISHGNGDSDIGGIKDNQNIVVIKCQVSNNKGSGVSAERTIKVEKSIFTDNHASGSGGAIYTNNSIRVSDSNFTNNTSEAVYKGGGAIYADKYILITDSTFTNNRSDNGGALCTHNNISVTHSIFTNNSSDNTGGAIKAWDTVLINDSFFIDNSSELGGAIGAGRVVINSSIFIHNSVNNGYSIGGAIYTDNRSYNSIITNSLFIANSANQWGASIACYAYSTISNNTFLRNSNSSSVFFRQGGIIVNNIFSGNTEDIELKDDSKIYNNYMSYKKINDHGNNIIKKHNLQPAIVGDVNLNDDNKTLASDSPVIDKGLNPNSEEFKKLINDDEIYNKILELLKTDLVGNKRVHNGTIDMGAVEYVK